MQSLRERLNILDLSPVDSENESQTDQPVSEQSDSVHESDEPVSEASVSESHEPVSEVTSVLFLLCNAKLGNNS